MRERTVRLLGDRQRRAADPRCRLDELGVHHPGLQRKSVALADADGDPGSVRSLEEPGRDRLLGVRVGLPRSADDQPAGQRCSGAVDQLAIDQRFGLALAVTFADANSLAYVHTFTLAFIHSDDAVEREWSSESDIWQRASGSQLHRRRQRRPRALLVRVELQRRRHVVQPESQPHIHRRRHLHGDSCGH